MIFYVGLVHHPVRNKHNELVTTSVTNLDIHDIARSAGTFGARAYFIITPIKAQHTLVSSILDHWKGDRQNDYNPDRAQALSGVKLASSVEEAKESIRSAEGRSPKVAVTGASFQTYECNAKELREKLEIDNTPCLLLFGTGWGLHTTIVDCADFRLEPIFSRARDGYNHLSVRSAAAVYLDRLTATT